MNRLMNNISKGGNKRKSKKSRVQQENKQEEDLFL